MFNLKSNPIMFGFSISYKDARGRFTKSRSKAKLAIIYLPAQKKYITVDLSKKKYVKDKEAEIARILIAETKTKREKIKKVISPKVPKKKEVKKGKEPPRKKTEFKWRKTKVERAVIENKKMNRSMGIDKYRFILKVGKELAHKKEFNSDLYDDFFYELEQIWLEIFKRHKKGAYFIRILQDVEGLPAPHLVSRIVNSKDRKDWSGFSIDRLEKVTGPDMIKDQVKTLKMIYADKVKFYLNRSMQGVFSLKGFVIEAENPKNIKNKK